MCEKSRGGGGHRLGVAHPRAHTYFGAQPVKVFIELRVRSGHPPIPETWGRYCPPPLALMPQRRCIVAVVTLLGSEFDQAIEFDDSRFEAEPGSLGLRNTRRCRAQSESKSRREDGVGGLLSWITVCHNARLPLRLCQEKRRTRPISLKVLGLLSVTIQPPRDSQRPQNAHSRVPDEQNCFTTHSIALELPRYCALECVVTE